MPVEINIIGKKTCGVASLLAVLTASPTYPQLLAALVSENLQEKPSLSIRGKLKVNNLLHCNLSISVCNIVLWGKIKESTLQEGLLPLCHQHDIVHLSPQRKHAFFLTATSNY